MPNSRMTNEVFTEDGRVGFDIREFDIRHFHATCGIAARMKDW